MSAGLKDPFGEFMGYYVPVGNNAVFEVLGVTCRKDAIFHSILCGSPEEVLTLELSVSAKIYERVSAVLPGIVDVTCQPFVLHSVSRSSSSTKATPGRSCSR